MKKFIVDAEFVRYHRQLVRLLELKLGDKVSIEVNPKADKKSAKGAIEGDPIPTDPRKPPIKD